MLKDLNIVEFIEETASKSPVPGGGSIAALCGSLSASLNMMVANLTVGKKKYVEVKNEMKDVIEKMDSMKNEFIDYIDEDAQAFDKVMSAFKLPKDTPQQLEAKEMAIQQGLKEAALVPLKVARRSMDLIRVSETVVEKGNSNAVTDGMVSAMLARTTLLSASLNVKINLASINDESFVNEIREELASLESQIQEAENRILGSVSL